MGAPQYINLGSSFPIIHIFGAVSSMITGINLFSVAKWFPSFLAFALIPILYLFVRTIFKEEKIALLSALLFASLQNYIFFSSLFVRQTYALCLALFCIYFYFSARHSLRPATYYTLSIVCLILTAFSHHLVSFMLIIFLSIHLFVTRVSNVSFLKKLFFGSDLQGEKISVKFAVIAFVVPFAYWMFVTIVPISALVNFSRSLFYQGQTYAQIAGISGSSIETLYGYIVYYGFFFFISIFSLFLLYGLFKKAKNKRLENHSFTLYLFLCLFVAFLSLYFSAAIAFPDRFLTFGWLFGFAPLTVTILKSKYSGFRRIGIFLLVASMLFNIYIIPPTLWTPRSGDTPATGMEAFAPSIEDYALSTAFNFSAERILAPQNNLMAIYHTQNTLGTVFTSLKVDIANFDWIIFKKETNSTTLEVLDNSFECSKIYDSGSLLAFKLR